jgi:hypothetical protein
MKPKKKYFKPTNDLSYQKIVELYNEISDNRYERNCDFVLSQNSKFSAFGNKIAFCQLINTWFRKNPLSKLRIYDNYFPNTDKEIDKSINHIIETGEIHTLLALSYALFTGIFGYSNRTNVYTQKFINPVERKLIYNYKELTKVNEFDFLSNEYFQIHPDFFEQNFFINNLTFYVKIGTQFFIKKEAAINEVTERLFKRIADISTKIGEDKLKEIQTYFYEIFDNTYKWGRQNWVKKEEDSMVEKSNRIFFISSRNFTNLDFAKNESLISIDRKLLNFAGRNKLGTDTKLLELSILDNGIGIVQTFKNLDLKEVKPSATVEYKYLIESFQLGSTSDTTSKGKLRGIGLSKVLETVKDAFLIIRSGHLFLYRDFGIHSYNSNEEIYLFDASDVKNEKSLCLTNIQKYPWAEGTLFTFIIPL